MLNMLFYLPGKAGTCPQRPDEHIILIRKCQCQNIVFSMNRQFRVFVLVPNSPRLGASDRSFCEIIILPNDNANGMLELEVERVTVSEEAGGNIVKVLRRGGSFGQVCVMH